MKRALIIAAIAAYIGAIIMANWLIVEYGFVPVGFGLMAPAGTFAAGVALMLRNQIQDLAGRRIIIAAILAGAALSAWLASPALALASGVAFGVSELADMTVYTPLRRRGWARAVLPASAFGALLDTLIFLSLAGFPVTVLTVAGQMTGKMWAIWLPLAAVVALRTRRSTANIQ